MCTNTDGSYVCSCNVGYQLESDEHNCTGIASIIRMAYNLKYLDINECAASNGGCSHTCINNQGSYQCQCEDGFNLIDKQCQGIIK